MNISGISSSSGLHAVSGASSGAPPQQKMSNLFDAIDTSGSASITQAQFEQAFQTQNSPAVFQQQGAATIFAALDPNGTGSVSKQGFVSTMSGLMASSLNPWRVGAEESAAAKYGFGRRDAARPARAAWI